VERIRNLSVGQSKGSLSDQTVKTLSSCNSVFRTDYNHKM